MTDHHHIDHDRAPALSEAGARRRDAMLAELRGEVVRVHRARTLRRRAVGAAAVAALVAGTLWLAGPPITTTAPAPVPGPIAQDDTPDARPPVGPPREPSPDRAPALAGVTTVATDRGTLQRYVATARAERVRLLDDDELLRELRAAGRDCGIVRVRGTARLTCADGDTWSPAI